MEKEHLATLWKMLRLHRMIRRRSAGSVSYTHLDVYKRQVFDFANLEYISSAGLRLVIAAYKKMAGKEGFRIVNVSDEVYDVFSLTGFDQKINIEKK